MSNYSLELDFTAGRSGSIPYNALAEIYISRSTSNATGRTFITHDCVTSKELDEEIDRLHGELENIRKRARVRFAAQ
jgi:hypothetical protein